jgi:CHAT domain-containing protein
LNADLAVLSACETAVGKLSEGEGMLGLSRAFFGANVPALVASLWPVADESTRILMESFYLSLENGVRPAKALRMAQVSLLNQPQYDSPKFWAPFIFIGDTE